MYAIHYNGEWHRFDSLTEAEAFVEELYNRGKVDDMEELEIVPYHWTMG